MPMLYDIDPETGLPVDPSIPTRMGLAMNNRQVPFNTGRNITGLLGDLWDASKLEGLAPSISPVFKAASMAPQAAAATRASALGASQRLSPWTITQEFIPGTQNQLRSLSGQGLDVALTDPQKASYTQEILSKIQRLPGELPGSRWTGAGWWDEISNPVVGMKVSQPQSNVEAIMAGLGRGSSQAAEAASQKVFGGGLLGGTKNAVEIKLGKPATKAQISKLQAQYGDNFVVTASENGARFFGFEGANPDEVLKAGKEAAKSIGGKAKPYVGNSMYYPADEYEQIARGNPLLAEQVRKQTAQAAQAANARAIMENPLQRFSYSPVEEILRKKQF